MKGLIMPKQSNRGKGSSLFLIELIISIAFFSLAAVVCLQLFFHAHNMSSHAADLTEAVRLSRTAAECFLASDGEEAEFHRLLALCEDGTESEARCAASYTIDGDVLHIDVQNTEDGNSVYTLDVRHYRRKGGDDREPQ